MGNFDFDVIQRSWVYLFQVGMMFTLKLTLLAMTGGIIFGTLLAMMRLSGNKIIYLIASGYVNLMRSVPLVLVIFWFYFLVPLSVPRTVLCTLCSLGGDVGVPCWQQVWWEPHARVEASLHLPERTRPL